MKIWLVILVTVTFLTGVLDSDPLLQKKKRCGYESCTQHSTNKSVLNVHLVLHTHDDVGWIYTPEQYYYGIDTTTSVKYILDSVVKELWSDHRRRFTYVESFFFFKWWEQQDEVMKARVRTLVKEGRLQFAGGAWSMNDEATTHYQSIVDQFTLGLRKLNETFGECGVPRAVWQIDPFGHSREFAALAAAMGFDGLFLGRIHYKDHIKRIREKTLEFRWKGDDELGNSSTIFTSILQDMYTSPAGLCFDATCNEGPVIDDPSSPEYNLQFKVKQFMRIQSNEYSKDSVRTNNILIPIGGDFHFSDARKYFYNLDKLISHINNNTESDINVFYSTPECYLKAVRDYGTTFHREKGDFFPYAMETNEGNFYWTGFYTSRPTLKFFERQANGYLQMAKKLQVLAALDDSNIQVLNNLKSALGIIQHHDAITGTARQHVVRDYERILSKAIEDSLVIPRQAFRKIMSSADGSNTFALNLNTCRLNESSCGVSESSSAFVVTVYNHLAWRVKEAVRIPVRKGQYQVFAPSGKHISAQLVEIPKRVTKIPTRVSKATHEIVFIAHLEPVAYKNYFITHAMHRRKRDSALDFFDFKERLLSTQTTDDVVEDEHEKWRNSEDGNRVQPLALNTPINTTMDKNVLGLDMESQVREDKEHRDFQVNIGTGVSLATLRLEELDLEIIIRFGYYNSTASGAYVFEPTNDEPETVKLQYCGLSHGPIVEEFSLKNENAAADSVNISFTVRVYRGLYFIENDWVAAPFADKQQGGTEIVVDYATNLKNNGEFYTDSNGRQMMKRRLNENHWNITIDYPIGGNYYPVTNQISIKDDNTKVSIITDRSEGGSSLREGEIELMLHRRLVKDDGLGLGETLNETVNDDSPVPLVARGRHRIVFGKDTKEHNAEEKKLVKQFDLQPQIFVSDASKLSLRQWVKYRNVFSWCHQLPPGLHLLTLEPLGNKTLLLRLENYLEKAIGGTDILIDLNNVFKTIKINSFREANLAAASWADDYIWKWYKEDEARSGKKSSNEIKVSKKDSFVKIKPKQIRTFVIEYDHMFSFTNSNDE